MKNCRSGLGRDALVVALRREENGSLGQRLDVLWPLMNSRCGPIDGVATTDAKGRANPSVAAAIDWLEERLSRQRYLVGDQITVWVNGEQVEEAPAPPMSDAAAVSKSGPPGV